MDNLTTHHDGIANYDSIFNGVHLRFFLVRIFYPCLLIWGTIGNALCLRVLLSKKFFKNSTCQYLAILAVIDILFILMKSSKHIYKLFRETPIFNTSKSVCGSLTFFSSALAHMASWILVIVSFDRYLIVTSRYRRRPSSVNRVFCSTSILIGIVALCNLYYFFILGRTIPLDHFDSSELQNVQTNATLTPTTIDSMFISSTTSPIEIDNETEIIEFAEMHENENENENEIEMPTSFFCVPSRGYEKFFRTYIPIFDILLVAVIPFFLLCFTNIGIIIYTMRNNQRMRQHRKRAHRRHQRLTIMLLSVTLAFIGLTCPSVIVICVNKIIYSMDRRADSKANPGSALQTVREPSNVQSILDICEALWYTKHAMNFILYTLSGQDFRKEFTKLFTQCIHQRPTVSNKLITTLSQTGEIVNEPSMIEQSTSTRSLPRKSKKSTNSHDLAAIVLMNSKFPSSTPPSD